MSAIFDYLKIIYIVDRRAYMENAIVLIVLLLLGIEDVRFQSVSAVRLVIIMAVACVYRAFHMDVDVYSAAAGLLILVGLGLYCLITKSIGMADIVVMGFIGMMKGVMFAVASSMCAVSLASLTMLVYMLVKHISGKREVPFIPFLGLGTLGVMICV
jgi:prepilin signal peptidase PulO-like enzyme (type II secretory pathway)